MSSAVVADRPSDAITAPLGGADISDFLHTLYDAAPKDKWFVVASFPSKHCKSFRSTFDGISDAVRYIEGLDENVFTSMGLQDEAPSHGRGTADDVTALTCLWIDIDIDTGEPKKAGYAKDIPAARGVIDALTRKYDLSPSLITSSGYGLHAYYVFAEPPTFADGDERERGKALLLRWKDAAVGAAAEAGCKIDLSPFDISRVMRVAGGTNWKDPANPKPARIIERHADVRYTYEALDAALPQLAAVGKSSTARSASSSVVDVVVGDLVFDADARPPFDKFTALMAKDRKFERTWKRKRGADLEDQSGSGYCMSLANRAVRDGWGDQEVLNLLIAWRRANFEDLKSDNVNSYVLTIKKARESAEDAANVLGTATASDGQADERESREDALARLVGILAPHGVHVSGARKLGLGGEGHIELTLSDGRTVPLGVTADVLNQKRTIAAIAAVTLTVVHGWPADKWRTVSQTILRAAGDGEAIGTSPTEVIRTWLAAYIEQHGGRWVSASKPDLADKTHVAWVLMNTSNNQPFWTADNRLVIHVDAFVRWLTSDQYGTRAESSAVRRWLRGLNFEDKKLEPRYSWKAIVERFEPSPHSLIAGHGRDGAKEDQGKIVRRVWISPPNFDPN